MTKTQKAQPSRLLAVLADYQKTFSTSHGRRVLRTMMKECGFMEPNFIEGDSHATSFNEGKRAAVLDVCNKLKMDLRKMEAEIATREPEDSDYLDQE